MSLLSWFSTSLTFVHTVNCPFSQSILKLIAFPRAPAPQTRWSLPLYVIRESINCAILISFVLYLVCLLIDNSSWYTLIGRSFVWGDLFYVDYFMITCASRQILCIMGHVVSKQSLSAYQILSQAGDSSAVCAGCQGCCHSNWVAIDGLLPRSSTDESELLVWILFRICHHVAIMTSWALHKTISAVSVESFLVFTSDRVYTRYIVVPKPYVFVLWSELYMM